MCFHGHAARCVGAHLCALMCLLTAVCSHTCALVCSRMFALICVLSMCAISRYHMCALTVFLCALMYVFSAWKLVYSPLLFFYLMLWRFLPGQSHTCCRTFPTARTWFLLKQFFSPPDVSGRREVNCDCDWTGETWVMPSSWL